MLCFGPFHSALFLRFWLDFFRFSNLKIIIQLTGLILFTSLCIEMLGHWPCHGWFLLVKLAQVELSGEKFSSVFDKTFVQILVSRWMLSLPQWQPLARMGLSIYLTHTILQFAHIASRKQPTYFSDWSNVSLMQILFRDSSSQPIVMFNRSTTSGVIMRWHWSSPLSFIWLSKHPLWSSKAFAIRSFMREKRKEMKRIWWIESTIKRNERKVKEPL